ncbi:MAG: hypothetical protein EKK53_21575 [Burkholderiales bacterium]|nr:MAG: hypothetical protein EKK53_21575 [Burkholderiales bacterium]
MRFAKDDVRWVVMAGGLVTAGPPQARREGTLAACLNYEPALEGGYRRTKGYERFSGKPAPSSAPYTIVGIAWTAPPAANTAVTIGAATAVVAYIESATRTVLAEVVGGIVAGTPVLVAGVPSGVVSTLTPAGGISLEQDATYLSLAADIRRPSIAAVPGSGATRGVASLEGEVYAWRDAADGLSGLMYRATAAGWVQVDLGEEIAFSNANTSVEKGDVLTRGGVTANVMAVVVETGSLASGVNTGRLIISGRAGGNFTAGAATSTGGGALTLGGAQTAITLPPGGKYRSIAFNFSGASTGEKLYVVNGVGRAFEFDGTTTTPINTGDPNDKPEHVGQHLSRLILAIDGSMMWSNAGVPVVFDGISGAQEFAVGAKITGYASLSGKALAIFTDRGGKFLEGAPSSGMELQNLNAEDGALPGAAVFASDLFALSNSGLLSFRASQKYGGFEANDVGKNYQDAAIAVANTFSYACSVDMPGSENQIRFMGSDGSGLVCLVAGAKVVAATSIQYPVGPTCMWSGLVGTRRRTFFGATDGFVYEIAELPSFDGQDIESYFKLNPASLKSAYVDKTFYDCFVSLTSQRFSSIKCSFEFSSGSPNKRETLVQSVSGYGAGGVWDIASWDTFNWDAGSEQMPKVRIGGSGHNISPTFYSRSKIDFGHTINNLAFRVALRKTTRMS